MLKFVTAYFEGVYEHATSLIKLVPLKIFICTKQNHPKLKAKIHNIGDIE